MVIVVMIVMVVKEVGYRHSYLYQIFFFSSKHSEIFVAYSVIYSPLQNHDSYTTQLWHGN